jgi:hypothetical protein
MSKQLRFSTLAVQGEIAKQEELLVSDRVYFDQSGNIRAADPDGESRRKKLILVLCG